MAAGFLFSLLVDGTPAPVSARVAAAPKAAAAPKKQAVVVKKTTHRATPAGVVTIAAVGDIVMGSSPNMPPDGGRTFFDAVATDLAGDVVLGNLEGTLSVGGGKGGKQRDRRNVLSSQHGSPR